MSEQYGEFVSSVRKLDDALREVRFVWNDQTARSFDSINDNMKFLSKKIVTAKESAISSIKMLKDNYDEDEFDNTIHKLNMESSMV